MAIRRSQRIVFLIPQQHAWTPRPCVLVSFSGLPGKQSVPCSFDLTSGDVRKVADVTVHQAQPWTVSKVPPLTVGLGLSLLVVLAAPVS
jgi:hypothetical protein